MDLRRIAIATAILTTSTFAARAEAQSVNPDCASMITAVEGQRNIPRGLLMAIAMTESGMNGRPNPYAMNIAGRSYHASGFQDMTGVIEANWTRGVKSIDVGCMQINLLYHGSRFKRLTDLLDPATNVNYGASYLIDLAISSGSWKEAVMSYHNRNNPARRTWYGCSVWNNYLRLSNAQSGYLSCGSVPKGSSTASVPQLRPVPAPLLIGYRPSGPLGPLNPGRAATGYSIARIGGADVDIPLSAPRPSGKIMLVGAGDTLPDIVNDDAHSNAFQSVKPADWSTHGNDASNQAKPVNQTGFGQVSSGPSR